MSVTVGDGWTIGPGWTLGGSSSGGYVSGNLVMYLDAGNVSSYPGTGTTWSSLVGGFTGAMGTGVSYSSASGGTMVFNGNTQATVNMVDSSFAALTNNLSVEAWYNTTNNHPGIVKNGIGSNGFVNGYYSGASPANSWKVTKYGVVDIYIGSIPQNTAWHQFVVTYSSTGGTIVYVDGAVNGTSPNTNNLSPGSTTFNIGQSEGVFMNGNIAIMRWYNKALTSSEVAQNFANDRSRFGI